MPNLRERIRTLIAATSIGRLMVGVTVAAAIIVIECWLILSGDQLSEEFRNVASFVIVAIVLFLTAFEVSRASTPNLTTLIAAFLSVLAAAVVGPATAGVLADGTAAVIGMALLGLGVIYLTSLGIVVVHRGVNAAREDGQPRSQLPMHDDE